MGQLANATYIWLYSDCDQAVWSWMADWAKTIPFIDQAGESHPAKNIWRVFATPDRAFGQMYKVLLKAGAIDPDIPEHEATIPLPFYSITRLDPVPEPDRDLPSHWVRAYQTVQLECPHCHYILSLAEFNTGVCPHCGEPVNEQNVIQLSYEQSEKTRDELLADKWSFKGSDRLPEPFLVQYQLDFWCKTFGEARYQAMNMHYQARKGDMLLNVDYPEPFGTQPTYVNEFEAQNNTDLEPGEDEVNVRYTMLFNVHTWLPPFIFRTGVVKRLDVELHNYDGTALFYNIENIFDYAD